MGDSLLHLVARAEKTLDRPLIVLADSGYPASKLLSKPHSFIDSTFIASTSISLVSGDLRMLPVGLGPHAKPGVSYVFHHPERSLVAYVEKKPKYTQCLVTNALNIHDQPVKKPAFTYKQALGLAELFKTEELQAFCRWPPPSNPVVALNSWKYVSEVTGVDLKSPVDGSGVVTKSSLSKLSLPAVRGIAAQLNIPKSQSIKKEALIQAIIKVHPAVREEEEDEEESGADEEEDELPTPKQTKNKKARKLTSTEKRAIEQFMLPAKKPKFVEVYTDHYGLQDRMNAILYGVFAVSSRTTPQTKASWAAIVLSLYNTYTLWSEQRATSQPTVKQQVEAARSTPCPASFYLDLFIELVQYCEKLRQEEDQTLSRRS